MKADFRPFESFKRGEEEGFRYYHELHYPRIYLYMLGMTLDKDDADEFTHEAFIALSLNYQRIKDEQHLLKFLYLVARNIFFRSLRGEKLHQFVLLDEDHDVVDEPRMMEDAEAIKNEALELLGEAMKKLSPKRKAVVELYFYQDMKVRAIAACLRISEQTVRNHLSESMKLMRACLIQEKGKINCLLYG
ncbi:hypothetical protein GCM10011511_54370 [Puia dinghuensis]|uniref:Sigma-70 family RNA polymerase sigma factor n=2 Tax=Puia dinghuensis TaxID=1792502 RepID=A0A8J2XX07_9BACT|nr:hypothetical protein GCM10011511_54370 [Puia dinghuensis]